ncbi:MAG TPA: aspartate kinase [Candidatus Dormibacteraeota bacterium]|nr:aspartate kinase [Candidatus Dormibacteraeota bacterium]
MTFDPTPASDAPVRIIVQKFGGTSVAKEDLREVAASRVLEARARGFCPVVVVSAMGRDGDPYATDTLLSLLGPAKASPNRDLIAAVGEMISAAVFAELLVRWGAKAQALSGGQAGILVDDRWGDAQILDVRPERVLQLVQEGVIPVVAGFQGLTPDGAVATLGRGGSDLSAVVLGSALRAEGVEIFTDVSGVMSADPRRVVGVHAVERITYEEMTELAAHGAKVMHHKAASWAMQTKMPYSVKGLRTNQGTLVDDSVAIDRERPVTGIAAIHDLAFVHILLGDIESRQQLQALVLEVFGRLAKRGISIDLINVNRAGVFFAVENPNLEVVREELRELNMAVRVRQNCAKLSIVGAGMRGTPGVMYRVVQALEGSGVEIIHSTDSNITISLLVREEEAASAEQAIHDYFHLESEPQ